MTGLDGLRAIAVLLVVCFHIGFTDDSVVLAGGWLGVDVFFVLSGYLITSLLLAESRRTGRISLRRFYLRRFLRLAPLSIGLVAVIALIDVAGWSGRTGLSLTSAGALSVLLYYANWWSIGHLGDLGSLDHTWSLSIEEQFYLVWAVLAVVILYWFRGRRGVGLGVIAAVAGGAAITMGVARHLVWTAPNEHANLLASTALTLRVYLSSFLRPDGLLWGCLLAVALHHLTSLRAIQVVRAWMSYIGPVALLGCVAIVWGTGSEHGMFFIFSWGLSVFNLAVAAVILWIVIDQGGYIDRALSFRPLRWIGQRAYGIYLLQPVVGAVIATRTDLGAVWLSVLVLIGSFAAAAVSFRFFETPFLQLKDRFSSRGTDESADGLRSATGV